MKELLESIEALRRGRVKNQVDARIKEFSGRGEQGDDEIFKELCFCILTANFDAERGIKIQKEIGDGFLLLPEAQLAEKLKLLGYRYPNARAKYIVGARKHRRKLGKIIDGLGEMEAREWLVANVKGIGYKEASHFLRNIGCKNLAIIDFHILDLLAKHQLIEKPKALTKAKYLEIEQLLKRIAEKLNLSLAELDLYLWHAETGKVLK